MATQQLVLAGKIVKKHNKLVRSKINIANKTASRILACLIACIHRDDMQFKESYSVPIHEYLQADGGIIYKQAKEACSELAKATVESEWPDPENPKGDPIFQAMPFFTSIVYKNGYIVARFNPLLSDVLLQLRERFTQYSLMEYLTLPSTYSQRFFEILKSWANLPEAVLSIKELHNLLNTPPSFRANFKAFRVYVLQKAHRDIHAKTQLRFEWEQVKVGRSVEAIRFTFGPRRKAIAEAEFAKAKAEKKSRLKNQRFIRALGCAKDKKGKCSAQDNRPVVCKLCVHLNFCEALQRRGA